MKFRFSHLLCINTFITAIYFWWECFFTPWGGRVITEFAAAMSVTLLAAIFWALVFIKEDSWIHKGIEISKAATDVPSPWQRKKYL